MDLGQDHGHLQDLSSPILSKIQEGFLYMRSCLVDDANDVFTRFGSLQGEYLRCCKPRSGFRCGTFTPDKGLLLFRTQ